MNPFAPVILWAILGAAAGAVIWKVVRRQEPYSPSKNTPRKAVALGATLGALLGFFTSHDFSGRSAHTAASFHQIESQADFETRVLRADGVVLTDFSAEWCPPCRMQVPVLNQLHAENHPDFQIVQVDVDSQRELAGKYNVRVIPTLIYFKEGKVTKRVEGFNSKDKLMGLLKEAQEGR